MRLLHTLTLPALISAAFAAVVPRDAAAPPQWDAIVIGGGPAGLSALSGLARVRRNVLLIDSGVYRNGPTRHMHDVLGFDGVTPAYFRWAARQQLSHYSTVNMTNGTVTKITPSSDSSYFTISTTSPSNQTETHTARKVVLATGLRDLLPSTPGLSENWGKGIYWCPWCDGHEHADQPLGLIGSLETAPGTVREVLTLNKDIIAFVNGTDTPEARARTEDKFPQWQKYLQIHNVTVENRTITAITRLRNGTANDTDASLPSVAEYDQFRVEFSEGAPVERAAFLTSFDAEQASRIGPDAGVALYGGRLAADPANGLATNIDGIYAIGDANSDNVTNVPHALFSGKRTAVYLHVKLERENSVKELQAANNTALGKRDLEHEARALWKRVNGDPRDILYAGDFDQ